MRVLLVHPDFQRRASSAEALRVGFTPPALGVNLLAQVLRLRGHEVDVLDSLRLALRYGIQEMPTFEHEVARLVAAEKVDLIGFNVTSPTRLIALRCARIAKATCPDATVVFGGPHSTIVGRPLLDRYPEVIDAVVCGEGEENLPGLLEAMDNGADGSADIPGVSWARGDGGPPILLRDLDCYPMASYQGYRTETHGYLFDTIPVMSARGCPYRCSFCYSKDFWSSRFRKRDITRVLDEIEYGLVQLGCSKVHFNDDMFSLPLDRGKAILSGMLERGLRAPMYCTTRIDCLDDEFLHLYERAGGGCIYFGIESGSERLRDAMQKRLRDTDIQSGVALLRKHPAIRVGFFLIFGYPGEQVEDVVATEELLRRTPPDEVTCNIAHVHPGTALFAQAVQEGRYDLSQWLDEEQDFFPYEQDGSRLRELHRLCQRVEASYGRPTQRTGLIRDVGTVIAAGPPASVTPRGGGSQGAISRLRPPEDTRNTRGGELNAGQQLPVVQSRG